MPILEMLSLARNQNDASEIKETCISFWLGPDSPHATSMWTGSPPGWRNSGLSSHEDRTKFQGAYREIYD